jgi:glycosyltransferase involved in cell wall biosynthesis
MNSPPRPPLVSAIIAAKDADPRQLARCIASFSALNKAASIEVIEVTSGRPAEIPETLLSGLHGFQRISTPPRGIYAAYNEGVSHARGTYLMFFGVDDIALPPLDDVIGAIESQDRCPHLIAAGCYMQQKGAIIPSTRPSSLAFGNWCHQGLLYLRDYLAHHPYEENYRIRADHKMNIDIVSDPSLRYTVDKRVIAYFSAGGASSMVTDIPFRNDFPAIVARSFGSALGLYVKARQFLADRIYGSVEERVRRSRERS